MTTEKKGTTATTTIFTLGAPLSAAAAVSYRQLSYWTGLKLSSSETGDLLRPSSSCLLADTFFFFSSGHHLPPPPIAQVGLFSPPPHGHLSNSNSNCLSLGDCAAVWIFILVRHFSRPWNEISSNICAGFQLHLLPWFGSPFKEERGKELPPVAVTVIWSLVCGRRGVGERLMAPTDWLTDRPITALNQPTRPIFDGYLANYP
mgnify:CR=1 FL=1